MAPVSDSSARSLPSAHPAAGRRTAWTTLGALMASAAFGGALVMPRSASASPLASADAILVRTERTIGPWDSPADLLSAAYRVRLLPGDRTDGLRFTITPTAADQDPPVFRFDIPAGSLTGAITQFERVTGLTVRDGSGLGRNLTTSGLAGTHTASDALERLLAGTGLSFRVLDASTLALEVRVGSSAIDVSGQLPSISSSKFSDNLIDVPQTVTVVTRSVIDAQGATTLRDVLRNVPGVTMQAGEGGGGLPGDTMTIRGFSASNDIFIDGIRDVGAYARDAFNLEQVEVIKGPSSTFGGRGSTGAAINLATKAPQLLSAEQGSVTLGSAGMQRTTIDVNERVTLIGDGAAFRFNAMWQDAGVPGRDVVNNASWAVAPSLAIGLGGPTRASVSYQHVDQDNVPDYGLPWGSSTDAETGVVYPTGAFNATPAIAQTNFYGLANYDFERITNDVATLRLDRDLSAGATISNVTRYGETFRDSAITAPRPPNRQLQRREMRNEAFANQTSLTVGVSTGPVRHDISAGFEAARETTMTRNSAQSVNQPQTNIRNPDPNQLPFGAMPAITGNPGEATTATLGGYLFNTVSLSNAWQVSGGLRWDRSEVDYRLTTLATGATTDLSRRDTELSWRAGVVYKPQADASLYLGYGTSFNPASDAGATGGALSGSDTAVNSVNLEPERSRNLELGTKWAAFGQRLAVTGAVFRTEKTNARTRNLNNEPYVLAGKQRVQGVELGVSGQLAPGWTSYASFAWLDSSIVDSANPTEQGRDLALTPERTASLWTTWQVAPRLSVGGGAQYMDAIFRNTTTDLQVPSYWLVNAMASYAVNSHLSLRFNGTNLGDESYVDRVGGGHYVPGPRRALQLTTSVGF